jgi:competence protein ComEA
VACPQARDVVLPAAVGLSYRRRMRSRRSAQEEVAEVARRRLELLSAELAEIRPLPTGSPARVDRDGSGEPLGDHGDAPSDPAAVDATGTAGPLTTAGTATPPAAPGRGGRHAHRPVGLATGVAGWTQDRLPATLQGRVALTGAHLAVVALLVLVGAAVTVWWVSRAEGGESLPAHAPATPVLPTAGLTTDPTPAATSPGASSATGSAVAGAAASAPGDAAGSTPGTGTGTGTGSVVVDVAGKVRRPGIATLPAGSRVVDALEAAGGPRRGARIGSLNLARVLADGEQIVVGLPAPPGVAASAASAPTRASGSGSATALVNVNSASQPELEELPGIGPVTAVAILDFRTENGPFTSVDELLEVSGIGEATLAEIAPFVTL